MELRKKVSNPMLVGCIQLMTDDNSVEHREMFAEELLKAVLLAPAQVDPAPIEDENGKQTIQPGSRIQFPMLMAPDGKKFFMGFTDHIEYQKWADANVQLPTFALEFDDYAKMLIRPDFNRVSNDIHGFIINCFGNNVVIPIEMVAGIMARKMGVLRLNVPPKTVVPDEEGTEDAE